MKLKIEPPLPKMVKHTVLFFSLISLPKQLNDDMLQRGKNISRAVKMQLQFSFFFSLDEMEINYDKRRCYISLQSLNDHFYFAYLTSTNRNSRKWLTMRPLSLSYLESKINAHRTVVYLQVDPDKKQQI